MEVLFSFIDEKLREDGITGGIVRWQSVRKVTQSQVFYIDFLTEALAGIEKWSVTGAAADVAGYGALRIGSRQFAGGVFAKSAIQSHGHAGCAKPAL